MNCPHCGKPSPTDRKTCPRRYHPGCLDVARLYRRRERYRSGGSKHGNTNLTEADVREIRASHAQGARLCDLARRYGMTSGGMCAIITGRTWRHVA